jgi:hypothetical protein
MKRIRILGACVAFALVGLLAAPAVAHADGCRSGWSGRPYGDYCRGRRWGRYGAKNPVKSAEEARRRLEEYYAGEDVVVGTITERELHFEAKIDNKNGEFVDRVIIDKRSGRIRSIY